MHFYFPVTLPYTFSSSPGREQHPATLKRKRAGCHAKPLPCRQYRALGSPLREALGPAPRSKRLICGKHRRPEPPNPYPRRGRSSRRRLRPHSPSSNQGFTTPTWRSALRSCTKPPSGAAASSSSSCRQAPRHVSTTLLPVSVVTRVCCFRRLAREKLRISQARDCIAHAPPHGPCLPDWHPSLPAGHPRLVSAGGAPLAASPPGAVPRRAVMGARGSGYCAS